VGKRRKAILNRTWRGSRVPEPRHFSFRPALIHRFWIQGCQGFTLLEVVLAMGIGVIVVALVVETSGLITKALFRVDAEGQLRAEGIIIVDTIEKSFRAALEYGGELTIITNNKVEAVKDTYSVKLSFTGDKVILVIKDGSEERSVVLPSGGLKCDSLVVKGFYGQEEPPREISSPDPRAVVVELVLTDSSLGISKVFKAAFRTRMG